jgi:hypothetical protein
VVRWILLFILLLIVGRLFWRVVDSIIEAAGSGVRYARRAHVGAVARR